MEEPKRSFFEEGQILLFNKPLYWTSFDLVGKVRNIIRKTHNIKNIKVGHAGTLDPLATGLMIICTGKFTKKIDTFRDLDKEYVATFHAGATTPSFDLETETDYTFPANHITEGLIRKKLSEFVGEQKQMPPIYSAKQIDGKRAYEFARKGIEKELTPVTVFFREIEFLSFSFPEIKVRIKCSKGTYIRSFACDLGIALESGCYLSALERTAIGDYTVAGAFDVEKFQEYAEQMQQN